MSADQFRAALNRLGLSQAALGRVLENLGGGGPDTTTVNRWARGTARIPAAVGAFLTVLEALPPGRRRQFLNNARKPLR